MLHAYRQNVWALTCLMAIAPILCSAEGPRDLFEEVIRDYPMKHGIYSRDYQGDWSRLPTGRDLARKDLARVHLTEGLGRNLRESYSNLDQCFLTNRALRLTWEGAPDKYGSTAFYIRNCKAVLVDRVFLVQAGPSNTGSHGVFIEDCETVVVRNSYFAGPLSQVHLRIENCRDVIIDRVEIAGTPDRDGRGFRNGIGIFVEGGQMDSEGKRIRLYSPQARTLGWLLIQNCWIHDYSYGDRWENKDGIQIHSAPDGVLFNNVVENWQMAWADGAFDISHRRTDLTNRVFRIERNVVMNSSLTKSPGRGAADDALFWVNNIFQDAFHGDYHQNWSNVFRFNTWLYGRKSDHVHYKLWSIDGPVDMGCNLVASTDPITMVYQNNERETDKFRHFRPDGNLYALVGHDPWLSGARGERYTWEQWQALGKDRESRLGAPAAVRWSTNEPWNYRLSEKDAFRVRLATNAVADPRFRVTRDFFGRTRPTRPAVGAVEPEPTTP